MVLLRSHTIALVLVSLTALSAACTRDKATNTPDSVKAQSATTPAIVPIRPSTGWNESEAGPVLLLSAVEAVRRASVVLPGASDIHDASTDTAQLDSVRGNEFELFDRSGYLGTSTIESISPAPAEGCAAWPVAIFRDAPTRSWRVGFSYRTAKALNLDSLSAASSQDSIAMTSELARLSSAITAGGDPAFQGLPFTVREAYRVSLTDAIVIVGDVVRTINEEANPREEHLVLIAEKRTGDAEYRTAFYTRSAGSEDEVRTSEILAAVRFTRTNRAAVIVSFEYEEGGRTALVERVQPGTRRMTWQSAYSGC
jgi:hypothetical protein